MLARAELRRSWRAIVALGLLAGVTVGIALTAAQVGRRTSTAYDRLVAAAGAPDAVVLVLGGRDDAEAVADLSTVESSWLAIGGVARVATEQLRFIGVSAGETAPPPGLFTPVFVEGGPPDPDRATDLVISEHLADQSGFGLGDEVGLDFLTAEEITQFDTGFGEPDGPTVPMRVVGIVRTVGDGTSNAAEAFSTPALAQRLQSGDSGYFSVFVRLRNGAADVGQFTRQVNRLAREVAPVDAADEFLGFDVQVPGRQRAVVNVTTRVLVIGLAGFAAIVAAAGLLTCGLALRRQLAASSLDLRTLAALGTTRSQARLGELASTIPFVVVGTIVGVVVALVLAGLSPIGSLAEQEPRPGWHPNVGLVIAGGLVAAIALAAVAMLATYSSTAGGPPRGTSAIVHRLARSGSPAPLVLGARFALEPGRGRAAIPVRSVRIACAVGLTALVAVLVWSSSLTRLVDEPHRWGWVADARFFDVTDRDVDRLVADDRIAAVTSVQEVTVELEGRTVPADALTDRKSSVGWTVLDGRMPSDIGEVFLGARLARELDRDVGDQVATATRDGNGSVELDVVGIGVSPNLTNAQFGGDVVVTPADLERVAITDPFRGVQVTFAPGVDGAAVANRLATELELSLPVRPPDVDNLAELGTLPELLAIVLAVLVVAVLFHFLVTTVRRRRREFDTLRAIGLRPRQTRRVVVMSALFVTAFGLLIGIPLGIVIGRFAWRVTAHAVYVAGDVLVPFELVGSLVVGAVVAACIAAAWPVYVVTRGRVARSLRDE